MSSNLLQKRWQQLPESAIRRLQAEQLRHYLRTVVLSFSAYYGKLFREHGLTSDSIHTLEDLQRVPFTTKADLQTTPESPQRFRDFILIPDQKVLARRPSTIFNALVHGRDAVKQVFESEFRPIFMTATTGRSAEPTPFFYTQHDLTHLATAARRVVEICNGRREDKMLNTFPFAPHLAFWLAHYAGTAGEILTLSSGGGKVMGTDGNIRHLDLVPAQLLGRRPLPGWAHYRTPITGLYLCGAGTHPGGGVSGLSGRNAAREILRSLKR